MKDIERKSVEQLFDVSEQFETRWQAYVTIDAAERQKLIDGLAGFVRLCSQNGIFIPPGSADRRALRSILDRWNSRLREAGVDFGEAGLLAEFDPKAGVVLEGPCPYPGLDAYSASRRGSFFGREHEIAKAVKHLDAAGNRILMIVGSSGSGKSSLALAGILPRLQDKHASAWLFAPPFTPGAEPITALAEVAADAIGQPESVPEIRRSLADAPEQAHAKLAAVCEGRPLMLLIDQFEELLTLCHNPNDQGRFARILCSLSDPSTAANGFVTRILLTLRTDHQDRFERTDTLLPLHRRVVGEHNSDQLSTIGFAEIRRAIKEPADSVGLRFVPPELVDRLASQTAGLANGLPLLQFALQRLWETRPMNADGQRLDLITREMVDVLPDVQGALGGVAEGLFKAFTQPEQRACERLLLELVVLDENFEEPLRRRRGETELIGAMERSGYAAADIDRVLGDFVAHHLVRRFGERPNSQLEVAHEALLRNWPHINDILLRSKERLHLIKEIGREAAEWVDSGHTDDQLRLHGDRLGRAVAYAKDGWLVDKTATDYMEACQRLEAENQRRDQLVREQRERVQAAERARREAELKEKLGREWSRYLVAALAVVTVFLFIAVYQWFAARSAKQAAEEAFKETAALANAIVFDVVKDVDLRGSLPPAIVTKMSNSANQAYDGIIRHNPENAAAYNGRGSGYLARNEFDRAIADFNRAIQLDPTNASYYGNRGTAYRASNALDRAFDDFSKAISLDPEDTAALYGRCFTLAMKGEFSSALRDCNESLQRQPDQASTLLARGFTYQSLGQFDEAIADFSKVIELNPRSWKGYENRGDAYRRKGELDLAINDFSRALGLNPEDIQSYFRRGLAWRAKGDNKKAIADYNAALELDPKQDVARAARCFARAIGGILELEAALADCNDSLKTQPDNVGTLDSRGLIYLKLGQFDNAIADYDAALRIDRRHAGALYGRGVAKRRVGDAVGGDHDIAEAQAIRPNIADVLARYGVR